MSDKFIVGVSGLATAGKDTACRMLIEALSKLGISAARIALADQLKSTIRQELIDKTGVDVLNCAPEQKESIRPALVEYGKLFRAKTQGTHWTGIVQSKLTDMVEDVIIVPDIRYSIYDNDEVQWVKSNKGLLIHVSRYVIDSHGNKNWIQPPNADERINDPLVRAAADCCLSWNTLENPLLDSIYGGFFDTLAAIINHEIPHCRN